MGGVREGIDGYPYLNNPIGFCTGYWGDQLGMTKKGLASGIYIKNKRGRYHL